MNKLKMLVLNLLNEVQEQNLSDESTSTEVKVNEPKFDFYTILVDDQKKKVKCGSIVTDDQDVQIEDGIYPIDGINKSLVIKDGKPEVIDNKELPSAEPQEIKEQDVKEELSEETQTAIDEVVNADINAEGATDAIAEEVSQNVAVENAFAKFQEVIDDLAKRVAELEVKVSASEAKVAEKEQEVADLKTELSAVKSVTPSNTGITESLWTKFYNAHNK